MNLKVVNNILKKDSVIGLRFVLPPVVLPVDNSGKVATIDSVSMISMHYAALVFIEDTKELGLIEFGPRVMLGLEGYARRYGTMSEIEILFSREDNDDIRMTIGRNSDMASLDVIKGAAGQINDTLSFKYLSKIGYQTHDYEKKDV